jgi:secondary thiamine-phosphate synthase enzyme
MWLQRQITLRARPRGFHLIDAEVLAALPELARLRVGLLHVFICHTSAALTLNENADPTVRADFEEFFSRAVPENQAWYRHCDEGADDLPAHIKASLLGASVTLPVTGGQLNCGVWQCIYLCEHRNQAAGRQLVLTLQGE